jgi:hypothetical protein
LRNLLSTGVLEAAKKIGIEEDDISELKYWDGESKIAPDKMDADEIIPSPSKAILAIYNRATPLLSTLFIDINNEEATAALKVLNDEIKQANLKDGVDLANLDKDVRQIRWELMRSNLLLGQQIFTKLMEDPEDATALLELNGLNDTLSGINQKYHYPEGWIVQPPGQKETERYPAIKAAKAREKQKKAGSGTLAAGTWRPGLTKQLEEILGICPVYQKNPVMGDEDADPAPLRCHFAVLKRGQRNELALVDSADIGSHASRGYLKDLPQEQRVDLRTAFNKFSHRDRQDFMEIIGFDCLPETSTNRYPNGVIAAKWENGVVKVMNRSGWRDIWGERKGDLMIEDFFRKKGLPIPFSKRAKPSKVSHMIQRNNENPEVVDQAGVTAGRGVALLGLDVQCPPISRKKELLESRFWRIK